MRWNGGTKGDKPVAFVGKGVTASIPAASRSSPAGGMEEMKGDMAGAACVTGLMQALAARKAKVNVIGVIGLVENMPDGNAQRPGDIVKTHCPARPSRSSTPTPKAGSCLPMCSGMWRKTASSRSLHGQSGDADRCDPGRARAPSMPACSPTTTNWSERLRGSPAKATGETVWRMPLGPAYDKMIDSKFADMKNTGWPRIRRLDHRRAVPAAVSSTTRHGRISTSPVPAWARRRATSTRSFGARAGACVCSTGWLKDHYES
jgi:leucyl aminopeptidase